MNTVKRLIIIVIYLTTLVNCYRVEYLCNKPNWRRQWGVVLNKAEQCVHGVVADVCNQGFVCRKGIGEHCGGHFNYAGVCGKGLNCVVKQVPTNPGTCQKYNSTSSNLPLCTKDLKTSCRVPVSSLSHKLGKTNIPPTILYKPRLPQPSKRPLTNQPQLPGVTLPQQKPLTENKRPQLLNKPPQTGTKQPSSGNKRLVNVSKLPQPGINQPSTDKKRPLPAPQTEISGSKNGQVVPPVIDGSLKSVANGSEIIMSEANESTTPSPSYASIILNGLLQGSKKNNSSAAVQVSRSGENVSATSYASVGKSSKNILSMLAKGLKHFGQRNASSNPQNVENQNGTNEKIVSSEKNVSSNPQNVENQNGANEKMVGSEKNVSSNPQNVENQNGTNEKIVGSEKTVSSNPQNVDSNEQKDNISQQIKDSGKNVSFNPEQVGSSKENVVNSNQQINNSSQQNAGASPQNASASPQSTDLSPQKAGFNPQNSGPSQQNVDSNQQKTNSNQPNVNSNQQNTNSNQPNGNSNQQNADSNQQNADSNQQNGISTEHHQPKIQKKKADAGHQSNSSENSIATSNSNPTNKPPTSSLNWLKVFENLFGLKSKIGSEEADVKKKSKPNPVIQTPNANASPISNIKVEPDQDNSSAILKEALKFGSAAPNSNVNVKSDKANFNKIPNLPEKAIPNSAALNSSAKVESDVANSNSMPNVQDEAILNSSTPISNAKVEPLQDNSNSKSILPEAAKIYDSTPISSEKGQEAATIINGSTPISNVKVEAEKTLTPISNLQPKTDREKSDPLSNSVPELKQTNMIQTRNFNLETNQNFKPIDTCVF